MNTDTQAAANATTKTFTVEVCETSYPIYEYSIKASSEAEALEIAYSGKASAYIRILDNDCGSKEVWGDTLREVA